MRTLALIVAVFAMAAYVALIAAPPATAAPLRCSAGGDWDPVEESDVIVGGRITSWERRGDVYGATPYFVPVELHMEIDHVWKGSLAGRPIIDPRTLTELPNDPQLRWGGGGSCGAIGEDPTGMYAVFGLHEREDGFLSTNLLTTFWLQPEPYDVNALSAPERRIFRLPSLGAGMTRDDGGAMIAISAAVMFLAGCATISVARRVRRS